MHSHPWKEAWKNPPTSSSTRLAISISRNTYSSDSTRLAKDREVFRLALPSSVDMLDAMLEPPRVACNHKSKLLRQARPRHRRPLLISIHSFIDRSDKAERLCHPATPPHASEPPPEREPSMCRCSARRCGSGCPCQAHCGRKKERRKQKREFPQQRSLEPSSLTQLAPTRVGRLDSRVE